MTIQKTIPKAWKEKLKLCNMNIKVKKEIRPFLYINNKISYDIPNKSKGFYELLKKQISKKSYMEKHWANLFPDIPAWSTFYEKKN